MTNLRKALLGSAALAVMATGAQADELSALKAQLEALQAQVNTMESSASSYNLPEGSSFITGRRGAANYDFAARSSRLNQEWAGAENSGYTIAITPTADMPAPVAEITVSGAVFSYVVLGIDGNVPTNDSAFNPYDWVDGDTHLHINGRGVMNVRSRVDTAIGQIRTDIQLRADRNDTMQMRYSWGEWDMTPNWTLGAGSFFQTASLANMPTVLNASGPLGASYNVARPSQVRLTYRDGPLSWAVALEEPTFESTTAMPNIATAISYDVPGGHNLNLVAQAADLDAAGANQDLGWLVGASAGLNLADVATLTVAGSYSVGGAANIGMQSLQGITGYGTCAAGVGAQFDNNGDLCESWGITAGLGMGINDTTSFNIFGGYEENLSALGADPDAFESGWVVGANIIWQPVRQLRMGWELNYGEAEANDGCSSNCTAVDTEALMLLWTTRFTF